MDENRIEFVEETAEEAEELLQDSEEELENGGFFSTVRDRIEEFGEVISDKIYENYAEPDEDTIMPSKKAWQLFAVCSAACVMLAVAAYFFFTAYDYYTTGYSVKEFIETYNSIGLVTSDSEIYQTYPSYTDAPTLIPEGAKLGGKNKIELFDGHVTIEADTRFGKIEKLYVRNNGVPGYNPDTYDFAEGGPDILNYFVILGKTTAAFSGSNPTTMQAASAGIQFYQYACLYYSYSGEGSGYVSVDLENNRVAFQLEDACLYVEPINRKITAAVWPDWLTGKDESAAETVDTPTSGVSASDAE